MKNKFHLIHEYDFINGVKPNPNLIIEWRNEIVEKLSNGDVNNFICRSTGNSLVIGFVDNTGEIEVIEVSNGHKKYIYSKEKQ